MTENKIKYNSYENSFYINDDEGISQIIAPELIIEIINNYEKEIVKLKQKNKELKKENEELKQFRNKVSELLTDEIKEENELLNYYLKEKAPFYANRQEVIIGVLKRLKKELIE